MRRLISTVLGIVLIVGSLIFLVWAYVSTRNYVDVTATVTAVEYDPTVIVDDDDHNPADYKVTMEYTVDGQTYTTEINAHSSDYSVGENVEIKYDPDNPQNSSVGELSLPIVIGIGIGLVVIGGLAIFGGRRF